jgi:hypothetical protein
LFISIGVEPQLRQSNSNLGNCSLNAVYSTSYELGKQNCQCKHVNHLKQAI